MIPNITRGARFGGLMSYLVGEGKANEHENPHLVAGDADLFAFYSGRELTPTDAFSIAYEIDEARRLMGTNVTVTKKTADPRTGVLVEGRQPANVWHCSLSLSAHEGVLSDEKWNELATEFVDRMGFTAESGKAECRWVAVRHGLSKNGNDHVHIAVSLVRADGTKASTHNDFRRAQEICRELEVKHGLAITGDRAAELGTRGTTPGAELAAERRGSTEADAKRLARLVRAASTGAEDEAEFIRRLRRSNEVAVRPRFAKGRNDVVEGYSVALKTEHRSQMVWHGGGKLARDLTLPRMRAEWPDTLESSSAAIAEWRAAAEGQPVVAPGREALEPNPELWAKYTEDIKTLREQMRAVPVDDRATWAIVAKESAGVLAAWSEVSEPAMREPLARMSDELARTAQLRAHQVRPRPSGMVSIGGTALLVAASAMKADSRMAQAIMIREMARTAQAIGEMIVARGDARRAEQMATVVRGQLAEVASRLPNPTQTPHVPTAADAALAELKRFENGKLRPREGTAVPLHEPPRRPPGATPPAAEPQLDK